MRIIDLVKIKAIFRGTKYVLLAHVGAPLSCDWGIQLLNFCPQSSHLTRTSVSLFLFLLPNTFWTVYWVSAFTIAFSQFSLVEITYYFLIAKVFQSVEMKPVSNEARRNKNISLVHLSSYSLRNRLRRCEILTASPIRYLDAAAVGGFFALRRCKCQKPVPVVIGDGFGHFTNPSMVRTIITWVSLTSSSIHRWALLQVN